MVFELEFEFEFVLELWLLDWVFIELCVVLFDLLCDVELVVIVFLGFIIEDLIMWLLGR